MDIKSKGLTVLFNADISVVDAQEISNAIMMIKGVDCVTLFTSMPEDEMNRHQVKCEIIDSLNSLINKDCVQDEQR